MHIYYGNYRKYRITYQQGQKYSSLLYFCTGSLDSKRDNVSSIYRVFLLKMCKMKCICMFQRDYKSRDERTIVY